jgi:hypothetical protein
MAKKKKAVKKAPKKSAKLKAAPKLVRTQFMADFTAEFIGSNAVPPWPAADQTNASVVADFQTFISILIAAEVSHTPPPTGPIGSLAARVGNFLIAQNWPVAAPEPKTPKSWQKIQPTVHLIEISVIADRLLKAINSSPGRGGAGSGWPPH